MKDINQRINELGIPLKLIYDNTKDENNFIKIIFKDYPTLKFEYGMSCLKEHLHTVYYGFVLEDKVKEIIEINYNISSKLTLDFNYAIDIFVNDKVAIQIKSVGYLEKYLSEIKGYLDTIKSKIRRLDISTSDYLFIFYDTQHGNKLYCIEYDKLYKIIDGLINFRIYVQPDYRIWQYSFYKYIERFDYIGNIGSPNLDKNLKEVINRYLY